MSSFAARLVPNIERGEGAHIWDMNGRRYLDALSGLFVVEAEHARDELAEAAAPQARKLPFFPIWSYAHPTAIELADRLATQAPGDLNKVFFSCGGGESVDDRGNPVVRSLLPADLRPADFDEIEQILRYLLTEAWTKL
jgi:adenosylmethionine-8-amino-7-oxononanoate aminotransferase